MVKPNYSYVSKLIAIALFVATIISVPTVYYFYLTSPKTVVSPSLILDKLNPTAVPTPKLPVPPETYLISGGTHNFQTFNNCGPSSLSMALSFFDIFVSQQQLGNELRPFQNSVGDNDDKSVTLPEIARKGEDFGFTTYHRPNGDIETLKQFISNDIPVITRTLWRLDNDIGHYRVVFGYNDTTQQIIQNDSLQGANLSFNYDNFLALWRPYGYEYVVLIPSGKEELALRILGENADEQTSWKRAVERIETELATNPNDVLLTFSLSVANYNIGNYEKSVEVFESVENQLPFRTLWYQIEPLLAYQKLKRYDELLPRIEKILSNENRAFSELYQIRGEVYLDQGLTDLAEAEFEKAIFYNNNFTGEILH